MRTVDNSLYDEGRMYSLRYLSNGTGYDDQVPLISYYRISPCGRLIVDCEDCVF